jgi:hypothetical protein
MYILYMSLGPPGMDMDLPGTFYMIYPGTHMNIPGTLHICP